MLDGASIGLKVDVDTLRGTREGVPRLAALLKKHALEATFYFSVGRDHTGRAMRRVFRKGFAQKVARTSVLKHYGLKTLMYGVLLPGPDIGGAAREHMRRVHDAGFEVGLHTYDHVRWQDYVAGADAAWTRTELERGIAAFERVFGFAPQSHAAAGWQINQHGLELEREFGFKYASDTRGSEPFLPMLESGPSPCPQIPTTLPTFDEVASAARARRRIQHRGCAVSSLGSLRPSLAGVHAACRARGHAVARCFRIAAREVARCRRAAHLHGRRAQPRARKRPLPARAVVMAEIPGRSGALAVQASGGAP